MIFLRRTSYLPLLTLPLLVAQVSAADVCTWTGRDCTGLFGCCTGIDEGRCCIWRTGVSLGWSVSISKVSAPGPWTAFTSFDLNCTTANGSGAVEGPEETACVNVPDVPGATNYNSGKWLSAQSVERRGNEGHTQTGCASPDIVGYRSHDGKKYSFKVPEGDGQLEYISQLVEAGDFEALRAYERA
ncbi:hypothetical protein BKA70DRAFT_1097511 [Coprinopsis sp. MPI-PUGE-AT-0042]|nr:hypothetical protein BKA70DRAFT_1097511 [Coprinopsis sp. MPI-PUGE-AT-0042]